MIPSAARAAHAALLDGPLAESPLRLARAVGDDRRVHMRRIAVTLVGEGAAEPHALDPAPRATLCGRIAAVFADEVSEALAARGLKRCPGCGKRSSGAALTTAYRAAQVVARHREGGRG